MIAPFPKIFAVGTPYIKMLFDNEVEITEKIDGSQFSFGKVNGEFFMRSKGQQLFSENPEKMFSLGIDYVSSLDLSDNTVYYCEFLNKPKHNILSYERVPKHNIILFGVCKDNEFISDYDTLKKYADEIDIEVVPLLFKGKINDPQELLKLFENKSCLGKVENVDVAIEGVVVKNYHQPFLLGGQPIPLMMGKYVDERFKEVHKAEFNKEHTTKGKWILFCESYRTEARWEKAIQHLREKGQLENTPKDIGLLYKEIKEDIIAEEKEIIKDFLWSEFSGELLRGSTNGFPEWYKKKLLESNFE